MKRYLKVYFCAALVSIVCIAFPWILAFCGIISSFDALDKCAIPSAIIALVMSCLYVLRYMPERKPRWIIFILNPSIFYAAFLIWFAIESIHTPWNGFSGLVP